MLLTICAGVPAGVVPAGPAEPARQAGTARVKRGMAEMLKGGVIMDVVTPEQAKIAEDAGAVAVMALERVPADIRAQGGVARMSDPDMIQGIVEAVSIPVMAKARIGHFVEAQVLQIPLQVTIRLGDESKVSVGLLDCRYDVVPILGHRRRPSATAPCARKDRTQQ